MAIKTPKTQLLATIVAIAASVCAVIVSDEAFSRPSPLGTAFTYQGVLKQSGSPVTGTYFLRFRLWDAPSGGSQVGLNSDASSVSVINGLFTASVDFGAGPIDGSARWLEVQVVTDGGATVTTLSPRQPLTPAPMALFALNTSPLTPAGLPAGGNWTLSSNLNLDNNTLVIDPVNSAVGVGTSAPKSALHVAKGVTSFAAHPLSPLIVESDTHTYLDFLMPFNSEAGILFRNPVTTSDAGAILFGTTEAPGGLVFRTGGNTTRMKIREDGGVVIGSGTSIGALYVVSATNSLYAETTTTGAIAIQGEATTTSGSSTGVVGTSKGPNGTGVRGTAFSNGGGTNYGVYGSCNNPAGYDFYAGGAGVNYGSPSSKRWKRNVAPIFEPLEMISRIRGVYFDWDAEHGGRHDIGMMGEEVGKVLPEIVAYEADHEYVTGMDYGKLTPLLVEAVKALRAEEDAQIERLRIDADARIDALQRQNEELRGSVATLEAAVARLVDAGKQR